MKVPPLKDSKHGALLVKLIYMYHTERDQMMFGKMQYLVLLNIMQILLPLLSELRVGKC